MGALKYKVYGLQFLFGLSVSFLLSILTAPPLYAVNCTSLGNDANGPCMNACVALPASESTCPSSTPTTLDAPCNSIRTCGTAPGGSTSCPQGAVCLPNPLRETRGTVIAGRIIKVLTGGSGMFALLTFIYGGFQWLTAAGNPEKIKKGRDIILWSVMGMVIIFGAYVATKYILDALVNATS